MHFISEEASKEASEKKETKNENEDEEIADFTVKLFYKIYVNKSIRQRKDLPDTTRDALLDLLDLNKAICKEIDLLCKTKHYSTFNIVRRTTFVSADRKKSIYKAHDLENFGLQQGRVLEHMLNSAKERYPLSKIILTFKIETLASTRPFVKLSVKLSSKRKALETDEEGSSLPLSSLLAIHEKKKSNWTSMLQEQSKVQLDKILYMSE
ncbi:MAG: hypothetical protein M1813_002534 [Trichoglossum hirsutum]|nr:MAG: hypothetical protein M1813_002534 [Trichoglossum hirsutum]